jgi:HK97 family phage major capsid protein
MAAMRRKNKATVFDYLMGYPVWVNNDMAVPAANAKSMIFGNLNLYTIRDCMEMSLFRFTDSAYTKLGQVGFLAWARMGGNLLDTAGVKYYAHSAT